MKKKKWHQQGKRKSKSNNISTHPHWQGQYQGKGKIAQGIRGVWKTSAREGGKVVVAY